MELNGFVIGPEIKKLFKIKVGTLIAEHPVGLAFLLSFLKFLMAA